MLNEALMFAYKAHDGQSRKDGSPYILHPVAVGIELAKNGASEALICAGLLHDTVEDAHITEEELRAVFPDEVVGLVMMDSEDKSLSWEKRKKAVLSSLSETDNNEYRMLLCADKLCNLRGLEKQITQIGERVWDEFNRGKEDQKWFYSNLVRSLVLLEAKPMYCELKETVKKIFDIKWEE